MSKIVTSEESEQRAAWNLGSKVLVPAKRETCRYYGMPSGCVRGDKCFYVHGEEYLQTRPRTSSQTLQNGAVPFQRLVKMNISSPEDLNKKIFVGGLSLSVESDDLKVFFQEKFGPVMDAVVIGTHTGDQVPASRGFGFVVFEHEESVLSAVQTHYVNLFGKKVEIKSAVPRWGLSRLEVANGSSNGGLSREALTKMAAEASVGSTSSLFASKPSSLNHELYANGKREVAPQGIKRGYQGSDDEFEQPSSSSTSSTGRGSSPREDSHVQWMSRFKEWLPKFLHKASKLLKEGECYPLSSLKGDFRATCGLELDHESIGYHKLSDFIKSFPELCKIKIVPVGVGTATHMVLIPSAVRMTTVGAQQVEENGQMKGHMAGRSYAAATLTCNWTANNEAASEDCALSSAIIGPQMRAINKHFDECSVSTESLVKDTFKHFAKSNGNEVTAKDYTLRAPVSASQNGAHRRPLLSSNHHGTAMRASVSPRKSGARELLRLSGPQSQNGGHANLPVNRDFNLWQTNGTLTQEFSDGCGKTSIVNAIHDNVSLQASPSHIFWNMKSGTNGRPDLVDHLAFLMKNAPDFSHTADSEVRCSDMHDNSIFCTNQAPVGSHTTKPSTKNFTEEPTTSVNQMTLTPCSTYHKQSPPFCTSEESSCSHNIWNFPHIFISGGQDTSAQLPEKSTHSFEFPIGEGKGKEKVQDVYRADSKEHVNHPCAFCSSRASVWVAFPCKHFAICLPCKDAFYQFKGEGCYSGGRCIVSPYACWVERWVALPR